MRRIAVLKSTIFIIEQMAFTEHQCYIVHNLVSIRVSQPNSACHSA